MRATDIIRAVLDILDKEQEPTMTVTQVVDEPDEEQSRFKQIFAMLNAPSKGPLANSPNEVVAPVSAVTTDAGGGVNGPKHPADIRVKDPTDYPVR
jgi:hypothetical protein